MAEHRAHPLLQLLAMRPQVLADHAAAYADLAEAEIDVASTAWRRFALLKACAFCAVGTAAVLAGVALMLWVVTPEVQNHALWVLWATPLIPALAAAACLSGMRQVQHASAFGSLRKQLRADLLMLREARTP
jgi:uncharacterized membrane protein YqjE